MTLYDLVSNVDLQSETIYCYRDYDNGVRFEISYYLAKNCEINYIYNENGVIYIEVDSESLFYD